VSIKNKLVTAVTTAGLLAGLFGSAFVPAARAAATGTAAINATVSTEQYNDATGKTLYYSVAAYGTLGIDITNVGGTADVGVYEVSISGLTIRSCVAESRNAADSAAGTQTFAVAVIGTTSCSATLGGTGTVGDKSRYTIIMNKLATGATATVTVTDPDGDTLLTYTLSGVASTADATVVDATKSAATVKLNADGDATNGETADVADEVIGGVDYFLPVAAGSDPVYNGVVSNQWGAALASATALIAELSNTTFSVGCDATLGTAPTSSGSYVTTFNSSAAGVWECEVFADSAASAGGTWTLTVKATVSGKIVGSVSGAYYGEVASITASLVDGDRVPEVAGADVDDFVKLVVKDANGKAYGLTETDALTITGYGTVAGGTTAGAEDMVDGTSAATKNYFKLDDDFCPASSTGKTASVQAATVNATGTSIKSNALTINCAAAAADALTIQKIEFSKNNPLPGEAFDVYVYMEDADGVLAGAGDGASADFALSLTAATDNETRWDGTTVDAFTAGTPNVFHVTTDGYGRMIFEIKAPATVGTAITVSDPSSSAIAKVYTTNDAYEGVLTVGPKKLKATADFGPAAAKKKVAFVLESTSGTTKTYYRRANASGVASFTLVVRGTWTVYATFGDEISDTGTMKK
jgi:hypothetical protein